MSQASAAAMNHNANLTFSIYAHFSRRMFVINFLDDLNFSVMISGTQSA